MSPYMLRKAPKRDLYWVVTKATGKKHSIEPLPREVAERQRRALYARESGYAPRGGAKDIYEYTRHLEEQIDFLSEDIRQSFKALKALEALFQREGKHTPSQEHQFEEYMKLLESAEAEKEALEAQLFHHIKTHAERLR